MELITIADEGSKQWSGHTHSVLFSEHLVHENPIEKLLFTVAVTHVKPSLHNNSGGRAVAKSSNED
ncbi:MULTISPECIES: hypothetical protein [unclassified Ruegeria]|uniref:hypothetical protein n=1 Tax=unclassified Ruegeria TaxID=2625375 RepID=UPI0014888E4D|nr:MULTISPECIES: hypothetical protein [unclassified Ruegeria]